VRERDTGAGFSIVQKSKIQKNIFIFLHLFFALFLSISSTTQKQRIHYKVLLMPHLLAKQINVLLISHIIHDVDFFLHIANLFKQQKKRLKIFLFLNESQHT